MKRIKIANIYNDFEDIEIDIFWDEDSKEIIYQNADTEEEWDAGETADTLNDAIDDTYDRYRYGWGLEINEI